MRLRCDDYPEIAPELRFINPVIFDGPTLEAEPSAEFFPRAIQSSQSGSVARSQCSASKATVITTPATWHQGWSNPPAHDHSLYQLVMNVRNAILDRWS